MKKMKRFLVAMLGGLTAIACLAGISACKKDKEEAKVEEKPSYDININVPGLDVEKCVHDYSVVYYEQKADCFNGVEGYKEMGCSKCGESITVYTGMGHDYGDASCTEPASCLLCGEQKNIVTAAHKMVAATCTEAAHCSECDYKEGNPIAHTWVETTCLKVAHCSVCDTVKDPDEEAHVIVSAFGNLVEDGVYTKDGMPVNADGYYYVEPVDCTTEGYEAFNYCATCLGKAIAEDNLAWALFNNVEEDRTNAEKAAYLFGSGLVYTEGYATIQAAHTMVNFYGTKAEVEAKTALFEVKADKDGNYIPATCETGAVKNFSVCKVCLGDSLDADATLAEMKAVLTGEDAVISTFAEGEALGHDYGTSYKAGLNATCVAEGFTESWECTRCDADKVEEKIDVLPHDGEVDGKFVAEKATNKNSKAATCTTGDYCGNCKTEWTSALGHEEEALEAMSATCTTDGYTDDSWFCTVCGYVEYDYEYKTGHAFDSTTKVELGETKVSCTTNAYAEHFTCKNGCGVVATAEYDDDNNVKSYKVVDLKDLILKDGKMTGHSFVVDADEDAKLLNGDKLIAHLKDAIKALVKADATKDCTDYTVSCEECNYSFTVEHNEAGVWYLDEFGYPTTTETEDTYNIGVTKATCTENGTCKLCGDDFIDAIGHNFVENTETEKNNFVAARPATCTDKGMRAYYICTNGCGAIATEAGDDQAEAVDKNGNTVLLTTKNYKDYLTIALVPHAWVVVDEKAPTCTEFGWNEHIACADCGKKATVADGFDAEEIYKEVKATDHKSSAEGSCATEVVCDACGTTIKNPNVQPDNHCWVDGECDCCKVACAHPSYKDAACTVCGKAEPVADAE